MASNIDICNSALVKIGGEPITAMTDTSVSAIACNQQYGRVRDRLLIMHPWNFATRRIALAQTATPPAFGYKYSYQLPVDCIRVVAPQYNDTIFKVEGRFCLTDDTQLAIQYLTNTVTEADFPPHFSEVFAAFLAADIAYKITQSQGVATQAYTMAQDLLKNARTCDAQEGTPDTFEASDWTNSRF